MAYRDEIHDLQARLTSRLQAAQSSATAVAWLAVVAAGRRYLLPAGQAAEVLRPKLLQRVPFTKAWFRGVFNARGTVCSLVNLADFVAACTVAQRDAMHSAPQDVAVTLHSMLQMNCAVQVEALAGLRYSAEFKASEPRAADAPDFFASRWTDSQGQVWQELNLRALTQRADFLDINV